MKRRLIIPSIIFSFILGSAAAQWQKIPVNMPQSSYYNYYSSISFVSDSVGFLSGCSGPDSWNSMGLFKTMDKGNSWTHIAGASGGGCNIPHFFADEHTGYSVITYGSLQKNDLRKTINGGASWYNPDTTGLFYPGRMSFTGALHFINHNTGFIAKDDTIYKTVNGGKSWQTVHLGRFINAFAFTSGQTGYAAGENILLKSTDGGNSWNALTTNYSLTSLSFPSATIGYAVGKNGTILKTTDAGNTWLPQASCVSNVITLRSMFCLTDHICYAVGDSGVILNTVNGGATWTKQHSGVSVALNSISCTSSHCYAVGDTSVILKTIDGAVGIENHSQTTEQLSVFPNPFSTEAILKTGSGFKNAAVVLYNTLGEELKTLTPVSDQEIKITRGNLLAGIYFVYVRRDDGMASVTKVVMSD